MRGLNTRRKERKGLNDERQMINSRTHIRVTYVGHFKEKKENKNLEL